MTLRGSKDLDRGRKVLVSFIGLFELCSDSVFLCVFLLP